MAEEENGQEKTEEATPKRLEKAREEGQIARSRELGTTILLMAGAFAVLFLGENFAASMMGIFSYNFQFDRFALLDTSVMFEAIRMSINSIIGDVVMVLTMLMLGGVVGALGLGGWLFSAKPLQPKLSRLNPLEGLKRMFSMKSLIELFKAVAKFLVVALVAVITLAVMRGDLLALAQESITEAISHSSWIVIWSIIAMSAATVIIAAVDVPFQIFEHQKKLRMTKQQVKDEFKDSEGKPEVKSRVRQIQRELAQSRMMASIPEADVVITNPTHFSVALKYDMSGTSAPIMLAKGGDEIALKIREIAAANDIPTLESPVLARAIYFTTEIDQEIPEKLYLAVAQVLAFIYQIKQRKQTVSFNSSQTNALNRKLDIPSDLTFDAEGHLAYESD